MREVGSGKKVTISLDYASINTHLQLSNIYIEGFFFIFIFFPLFYYLCSNNLAKPRTFLGLQINTGYNKYTHMQNKKREIITDNI